MRLRKENDKAPKYTLRIKLKRMDQSVKYNLMQFLKGYKEAHNGQLIKVIVSPEFVK